MMRAIHIESRSKAVILDTPVPTLRQHTILVQPKAVAVQPSDWKHVDYMWVGDPTGVRLGFEYAGDVVDIGAGAHSANGPSFAKGDRVFGLCHATNIAMKQDGTFAQLAIVRPEFQMKIPRHLSYAEAATISSSLVPVCQGLYQNLRLPMPSPQPPYRPAKAATTPLLIYGGSTVSGMMGIQFAKLSNCLVVVTCSPQNFPLMASLGADHCIDYHSATCADEIKAALAGAALHHAWDCIATPQSARLCAEILAPSRRARYSSLLYLSPKILARVNPRVTCTTTVGYTVFGEAFTKETVVEARPEDCRVWLAFWKLSEQLLRDRKIRPPPVLLNVGGRGLEGVLHGLQHLKSGHVSAGKLVYTLDSDSGEALRPSSERASSAARQVTSSHFDEPLFSACMLDSAFEETKRLTDDIVAKGHFAGYFDKVHTEHISLCVALISECLAKSGCDLATAAPGAELPRIKGAPGAENQLTYCYQLLRDAGLVHIGEDDNGDVHITRTDVPVPARRSKDVLRDVVEKYAAVASVSELIQHVGGKLAEVWSGRTDGVGLVFGTAAGRRLIHEVYGVDASSQAFHRLLEHFLERVLGQIQQEAGKQKRTLRLLELGAGTGGTTKWLAILLSRFQYCGQQQQQQHHHHHHQSVDGAVSGLGRVVYTFTDIASGLVAQASRTFQQHPFMLYRVYDMEQAPESDLCGTQDVVVAVNAVHATSDMVKTLSHMRALMRPGGIALVLEIQERACWADFVFGLFEGWWRFNDGRTHAIASVDEWQDAFQKAGFSEVDWTEGTTRDSRFQRLFLARK